jgi:glycosyltransferase involved in cell wall biosynthesis
VVFSWYRHPGFRNAMRRRSRQGRPWCLWSETPRVSLHRHRGSRCAQVLLWPLWTRHAPIWAIGQWGIEGYRKEFGDRHAYIDLPYFSNLTRFRAICNPSRRAPKRVLYVGSLIPRKGLDVLAAAWRRIAPRFPSARLSRFGIGSNGAGAGEDACAGR